MKKLTAQDLIRLAQEKKSVTITMGGRMPAAFLISMQFNRVMSYLDQGVYEYKKKKNPPPFKTGGLIKSDF